jgi:hypothetical protein
MLHSVLMAALAYHPLELLWTRRWNTDGSPEVYQALVPFLFVWLIWVRREHLRTVWNRFPHPASGVTSLLAGSAVWLIDHIWRWEFAAQAAWWWVLCGAVRSLCGEAVLREVRRVAVVLVLMLPIPVVVRTEVVNQMRYRSAQALSACLQAAGRPARRDVFTVRIDRAYVHVRPSQCGVVPVMVGVALGVSISVWAAAPFVPALLLCLGAGLTGLAFSLLRLWFGALLLPPEIGGSNFLLSGSVYWTLLPVLPAVVWQAKRLGVCRPWSELDA